MSSMASPSLQVELIAAKQILVNPNYEPILPTAVALIEMVVDFVENGHVDILPLQAAVATLAIDLDLFVSATSDLLGEIIDLSLSVLGNQQCQSSFEPELQITEGLICASVSNSSAVDSCKLKTGCKST